MDRVMSAFPGTWIGGQGKHEVTEDTDSGGIKKWVKSRLEKQGLTPRDIGKIGGLFLGAKYLTYGCFLFVGIRYRPLFNIIQKQRATVAGTVNRQIDRSRRARKWFQRNQSNLSNIQQSMHRAHMRWRQKRKDFLEKMRRKASEEAAAKGREIGRVKSKGFPNVSGTTTSGTPSSTATRASAEGATIGEATAGGATVDGATTGGATAGGVTSSTSCAFSSGPGRNVAHNSGFHTSNSASHSSTGGGNIFRPHRLKSDGSSTQGRHHRSSASGAKASDGKWSTMQWLMDKYYELAMKLSAQAEKSAAVNYLAKTVNNDPKVLALGLAEGTILYKLTFPVTAAFEFFVICKLYLLYKDRNGLVGNSIQCQEVQGQCQRRAAENGLHSEVAESSGLERHRDLPKVAEENVLSQMKDTNTAAKTVETNASNVETGLGSSNNSNVAYSDSDPDYNSDCDLDYSSDSDIEYGDDSDVQYDSYYLYDLKSHVYNDTTGLTEASVARARKMLLAL